MLDWNETFRFCSYIYQQSSKNYSIKYVQYYALYKHFAEAPQVCICPAAGKTQVAISIRDKQKQTILHC